MSKRWVKFTEGKSVNLWERDVVEVRARTRPADTRMEPLEAPEASLFAAKGVPLGEFRQFLADNRLALIVSRNVTRRDGLARAQPFNLKVRRPGGVQSIGSNAALFDVDPLQLFQAEQLRGVRNDPSRGRRVLAQPMKPMLGAGKRSNPTADPNAPAGSVKVAADGSIPDRRGFRPGQESPGRAGRTARSLREPVAPGHSRAPEPTAGPLSAAHAAAAPAPSPVTRLSRSSKTARRANAILRADLKKRRRTT